MDDELVERITSLRETCAYYIQQQNMGLVASKLKYLALCLNAVTVPTIKYPEM